MKKIARMFIILFAGAICSAINSTAQAQIITTIAGDYTSGFSGDGGAAVYAQLAVVNTGAVDNHGNLYVTDGTNNRIRKINAAGIISTIAGTGTYAFSGDGGPATAAELNLPLSIYVDSSGVIFFTDQDNQRIRKISTTGIISTIAGNGVAGFSGDGGQATDAELNTPQCLTLDASGNIYFSDYSNNRIRKISPSGIITTYAGSSTSGFSGDGGPASAASISNPFGIAIDRSSNLFFADAGNNRVRKVSTSGIITTIAGSATSSFSGDGGPASSCELNGPAFLAVDAGNNLYINDFNNHRIRKIDTTGIISTVAGNGTFGHGGDGGPATAAQLGGAVGITTNATGLIYLVDGENFCIRMVSSCAAPTVPPITGLSTIATGSTLFLYDTASGGSWFSGSPGVVTVNSFTGAITGVSSASAIISYSVANSCGRTTVIDTISVTPTPSFCNNIYTIAGNGLTGFNGDGGRADTTHVTSPTSPVFDTSGNLYYVDGTSRIRMIAPSGIVTTVAGSDSVGYSGDGGPATSARLYEPSGMWLDNHGNIFISDWSGVTRKVDATGIITTIAGHFIMGSGFGGDGGPATDALFGETSGITVDSWGNFYLADGTNNRIRKVDTLGIVNTIAGSDSFGYAGDGGPASLALLNFPGRITCDAGNNIYFSDEGNNCVRKITPSGIISTVAGNGIPGFSGDGGPATAATFGWPTSVNIDRWGNLFIADLGNNRVRKVSATGIVTTVAGQSYRGYSGDSCSATAAELYWTDGTAVDSRGNIFIADCFNSRLRKVVTDSPYAGRISGLSHLAAGDTTVFSATVAGGSWSSSNLSVATIDATTGVLSAVATGTTTISYTLSGSCGTATITLSDTVSVYNRISGNINFTGSPVDTSGMLKVWLITYSPSTMRLEAVDSTYLALHTGTTGYYEFIGAAADSYRVKAAYFPPTFDSIGYVPTYHTSSLHWGTADVVAHTTTTANDYTNINMLYGTATTGPGFIGGLVTEGADRGTSGTIPVINLLVLAVNTTTGALLQQTYTDAAGHYSFGNLPVDQSYMIYPEGLNYVTTPYASILLTASNPTVANANFIEHTISKTITPANLATPALETQQPTIVLFPNPSNGKIIVQYFSNSAGKATVSVSDVFGKEIYKATVPTVAGNGNFPVDLSALQPGVYIINVNAGELNYRNKVEIR